MAEKTKTDLKALFGAGDKLKAQSFIDLIDSLISTKGDSNISGSLSPEIKNAFDLGSTSKPWKAVFASGSFNFINAAGTITSLSQTNLDELKAIESLRKSDSGIPIKRLRAFNSASAYIDFNTTSSNAPAGTAIDVVVNNSLEVLHVSETRMSIGPTNNFPVEVTGALDVAANSSTPHKLGGVVQITGKTQGSGTSGLEISGSLIQSSSGGKFELKPQGTSFTDGNVVMEDAIISQAGVISQSINIGTTTSPSIAEYIGVGINHSIMVAAGAVVSVFPGSRLIVKQQQPNIIADNTTGNVTVSSPGGGTDITFNIGSFGTNPRYVGNHINIPAGNFAGWYGPIHIGKKVVPNDNTIYTTNLGSIRINNGSQLRIKAFVA